MSAVIVLTGVTCHDAELEASGSSSLERNLSELWPVRRRVHLPDITPRIRPRGHNRDASFFAEDDYVGCRR